MLIWRGLLEKKNDIRAGVNLAFALNQDNRPQEAQVLACTLMAQTLQEGVPPSLRLLMQQHLSQLLDASGAQNALSVCVKK